MNQRVGSDLTVAELLERNMALGEALALERHRLRNLLEGLKAENVEDCMKETPERMRVLGAILAEAADEAVKVLSSVRPEARRMTVESLEDIDRRTMLAESAVAEAIDAEPELLGPMPDAMWEAINGDRDATMAAMRIAVRQTKAGIKARLGCSCGPQHGEQSKEG